MSWRAHGSRAWLMQRISAVYLLVYIVIFGLTLLLDSPTSYSAWREWMGLPFIAVATSGFFVMLLMHAWVGLRDVIMDYVHPPVMRFILLTSVALGLFAMGLWVLRILMLIPLPTIIAASGILPLAALVEPFACALPCTAVASGILPLATLVHPCTAGIS